MFCELKLDLFYTILNLTFSRKLIKYFKYFCMRLALFFCFFDSWYIIKYSLTETLESSVFCSLDPRVHILIANKALLPF